MTCKYLTGTKINRCLASERLMMPSLFELGVFCKGSPESCPIYQLKEKETPEVRLAKVYPLIEKMAK
jgi:hypothetical protein